MRSAPPRPSLRQMVVCASCSRSIRGTCQMLLTSCMFSTCATGTWQKEACMAQGLARTSRTAPRHGPPRCGHPPKALPARCAWSPARPPTRTSFSLTPSPSGSLLRQASRSALRPSERSVATLCCVGLVFCSPTTPMTGTRLTCTTHRLPARAARGVRQDGRGCCGELGLARARPAQAGGRVAARPATHPARPGTGTGAAPQ